MIMPIGIGVYKKEDYGEIFSISTDKDNMEEHWEGWHENKLKLQRNLKELGVPTVDVLPSLPRVTFRFHKIQYLC